MSNLTSDIQISIHDSIQDIGKADWELCARGDGKRALNPFTTYRFLNSLEVSKSVGPGTGWQPLYLKATQGTVTLAVVPCYLKTHSQGEYVFDHAWADAYVRAGGNYFPKLQIAVPFTPVTGPRFLLNPQTDINAKPALFDAIKMILQNNSFSSAHITFCSDEDVQDLQPHGAILRTGLQFHWHNKHYETFDEFLGALTARKRKNIKKERRQAQNFGGTIEHLTGDDIKPDHWDAFWKFYQNTSSRKWGRPYLTREWFDEIHHNMRDDVLLIMAKKDGDYVAGALNFMGKDCLYGRYWGCTQGHNALHFELCYYQAIEHAIAHNLTRVEAGAQGDHKRARGYEPVRTSSLHWFLDEGFQKAVDTYLQAETPEIEAELDYYNEHSPFQPKR